jgi:hypothetical protein
MPIAATCPNCTLQVNAPDAAAGKRARCPRCQQPFIVPSVGVTAAPPPPAPRVATLPTPPPALPGRPLPRWLWPALFAGSHLVLLPVMFLVGRASVPSPAPSPAVVTQASQQPAASVDVPHPVQPESKPEKVPEKAIENPKVRLFKDRVASAVEEGRALANLIDTIPSTSAYKVQLGKFTDAITRIPDPPDMARALFVSESLKSSLLTFRIGEVSIGQYHEFVFYAVQKSPMADENAKKTMARLRDLAKEQRKDLARIEADLEQLGVPPPEQPAPAAKTQSSSADREQEPAAKSKQTTDRPTVDGQPLASGDGTVNVKGYTRKDGTYVAPYTRKASSGGKRR